MYSCDICMKDHWEPNGLRTIQARYVDREFPDGLIWTFVCCVTGCADKARSEATTVLTDEPFRGEYLGDTIGYI